MSLVAMPDLTTCLQGDFLGHWHANWLLPIFILFFPAHQVQSELLFEKSYCWKWKADTPWKTKYSIAFGKAPRRRERAAEAGKLCKQFSPVPLWTPPPTPK